MSTRSTDQGAVITMALRLYPGAINFFEIPSLVIVPGVGEGWLDSEANVIVANESDACSPIFLTRQLASWFQHRAVAMAAE